MGGDWRRKNTASLCFSGDGNWLLWVCMGLGLAAAGLILSPEDTHTPQPLGTRLGREEG